MKTEPAERIMGLDAAISSLESLNSNPVSAGGAGEQVTCPDCVEGKITAGCAIDKPLISVDCGRCKGTGKITELRRTTARMIDLFREH